jgi:YYY domain-containing protein
MLLSEFLAAIRWWAILMFLGAAATPLSLFLFRRLPERGYAFTKLVGLLVVSYLFWLLGSFGLLGNDIGGMLFALLGLLALSAWTIRQSGPDMLHWLRDHKSQVVVTEVLFALVFAVWVWVRSQNPAITDTEKPMEFAFLNAIGRSPSFPPLDPWLSDFAISYYYFGYVMTSLLARLALVSEPVAFNLGIAWLVAGTAVAAFGLVYNLIATFSGRRNALTLGLVAALALPLAGNLEIVLEVLHGNGVGSAEFWRDLDIRDLNEPADASGTPRYETTVWWWWRSSRVIHEYHLSGREEAGLEPIAEVPSFSFALGDMHPHVLALPFAFLSVAVAFSWWLRGSEESRDSDDDPWDGLDWIRRVRYLIDDVGLPLWAFTAVVLGGLSFLNTWDVLIHLIVVLGAFLLSRWLRFGWHGRILGQTVVMAIMLLVPSVLLYLPFYIGFRSQAGAPYLLPMLMRPTRLPHFLIIFGMPLWSIVILMLWLAVRQRFRHWRAGLITAVTLVGGLLILMAFLGWIIASSSDGAWRVISLAGELDIDLPVRPEQLFAPGWGASAVAALAATVLKERLFYPGVTLLLAGMLGLCVMVWIELSDDSRRGDDGQPPSDQRDKAAMTLPFALLLVAIGAMLSIGPEYVYLRDNFGMRLNTVFKFYYQAWVMFGTAALFALGYLWHRLRQSAWRLIPALSTSGYTIMLGAALLFPIFAIQSRAAEFQGSPEAVNRQAATLDGLARMNHFDPDEHSAVMWLRETVQGAPVILEAVGGQYSSFARVSASTGLPTVLGWAGHELQWRGSSNPEPGIREPVVRQIYSDPGWESTAALLDNYRVEYVYVGDLELNTYGPQIREKLDAHLTVAYSNDSVTIYQWRPQ